MRRPRRTTHRRGGCRRSISVALGASNTTPSAGLPSSSPSSSSIPSVRAPAPSRSETSPGSRRAPTQDAGHTLLSTPTSLRIASSQPARTDASSSWPTANASSKRATISAPQLAAGGEDRHLVDTDHIAVAKRPLTSTERTASLVEPSAIWRPGSLRVDVQQLAEVLALVADAPVDRRRRQPPSSQPDAVPCRRSRSNDRAAPRSPPARRASCSRQPGSPASAVHRPVAEAQILHGKAGVDGSSPSEGFPKCLQVASSLAWFAKRLVRAGTCGL